MLKWSKSNDNDIYTVVRAKAIDHITPNDILGIIKWAKNNDIDLYDVLHKNILKYVNNDTSHQILEYYMEHDDLETVMLIVHHIGFDQIKIHMVVMQLLKSKNIFDAFLELDTNCNMFAHYSDDYIFLLEDTYMFNMALKHGLQMEQLMSHMFFKCDNHVSHIIHTSFVLRLLINNPEGFLINFWHLLSEYADVGYRRVLLDSIMEGYTYKAKDCDREYFTLIVSNKTKCKVIKMLLDLGLDKRVVLDIISQHASKLSKGLIKGLFSIGLFTDQAQKQKFLDDNFEIILKSAITRDDYGTFKYVLSVFTIRQSTSVYVLKHIGVYDNIKYAKYLSRTYNFKTRLIAHMKGCISSYYAEDTLKFLVKMATVYHINGLLKDVLTDNRHYIVNLGPYINIIIETCNFTHDKVTTVLNVGVYKQLFVEKGFRFIDPIVHILVPLDIYYFIEKLQLDGKLTRTRECHIKHCFYNYYDESNVATDPIDQLRADIKSIE